jgi:hypothetical protein
VDDFEGTRVSVLNEQKDRVLIRQRGARENPSYSFYCSYNVITHGSRRVHRISRRHSSYAGAVWSCGLQCNTSIDLSRDSPLPQQLLSVNLRGGSWSGERPNADAFLWCQDKAIFAEIMGCDGNQEMWLRAKYHRLEVKSTSTKENTRTGKGEVIMMSVCIDRCLLR